VEKRPGQEPDRRHGGHVRKRGDTEKFWADIGVDVERMSPKAQAVTGVVTGGLILLAATLLIAFTNFWWLIFVFGWAVFPAFGVFARGVAGLVEARSEPPAANARERELLEALQRRGELTPAQAAMETSLTVNEADKMLEELAAKGHLDVRVRGGGLFYGLWEQEGGRRELSEGG
jgi:hypothetical protein